MEATALADHDHDAAFAGAMLARSRRFSRRLAGFTLPGMVTPPRSARVSFALRKARDEDWARVQTSQQRAVAARSGSSSSKANNRPVPLIISPRPDRL
jgi:hypothetical protein